MVDTSASPTISAEAVCAVRRGLRIEFSRPSFPEMRKARAIGRPITLAIGRATVGASIPMPMKIGDRAETDELDGGFRQPEGQRGDAEDGDDRADDDPSS